MSTLSVGDKIKNRITGTKGEVVGISNLGLYEVIYAGSVGLRRNQPEATLELVSPGFLHIAESKPDFATFIDYLRTPAAEAKLYFKARCLEDAPALQDQYRDLSGRDTLVEGKGYAIMDTNKWSNEGLVSFKPLSEYPPAVKELLAPNRDGLINHIQFVWLLIKEGFKVSR